MRKLVIGLALATTTLATPAMARDHQWYVGGDGGVMIQEDLHGDITQTTTVGATTTTSVLKNAITQSQETGYDFGGYVGYDFGSFRLEAETSFRESDPKSLTATGIQPYGVAPAGTYSGNVIAGDVNSLSFMVNGLLDFGPDDGLQGFVGAGAGVARTTVHNNAWNTRNTTWGTIINDSDTGFAWQALAGIRAPLTDHWDAGIKYRFFNQGKIMLTDTTGRSWATKVRDHSLMGSLMYNFGGKAPPPPPVIKPPVVIPVPVRPPVVIAPPPPMCNKGPYIVYFDWNKSNISNEAASVLNNAVAAYANCSRVPIMLAGYTDRSGSPQYNIGLSERRNQSVQAYLTSKGIPSSNISAIAYGETHNAVPTADGVREPMNRRVTINYGPGSGN